MTLDQLMAFAITEDPARQEQVPACLRPPKAEGERVGADTVEMADAVEQRFGAKAAHTEAENDEAACAVAAE